VGIFDRLAAEYYDAELHPTSANFREGSRILLRGWLAAHAEGLDSICEVGPGSSLVAEESHAVARPPRIVLADDSLAMLRHSRRHAGARAALMCADAGRLPVRDGAFGGLVSILGDAYNAPEFWHECARVLRPNGVMLFTTPSYEWATRYRSEAGDHMHEAMFTLSDGSTVAIPSRVLDERAQTSLVAGAHLSVEETEHVRIKDLEGFALSPRLGGLAPSAPIVTAYRIVRR
jgi:SAM-dependent methyltransferase